MFLQNENKNISTHLKVKNLNLFYGKEKILKDINVVIPDKKLTVIIGPSGCGKTTLLKCFNRLIDNDENVSASGEILIDNENILDKKAELTHIRKKMGLLLQRPYPLPGTIIDNVAYGMKINGIKNKKILHDRVEYYLKEVNLWDEVQHKLHSSADKLSVGQQQRLCLARGLAVEPEIILADEPTSALDPVSAQKIENMFFMLKKEYTIVMVTHILRQAKRIADYVIFMYLGEIIETGPADIFFNNPVNKKTKEYLSGIIS